MRALLLAVGLALGATAAHAFPESLAFCDRPAAMTAPQQDRLLRFAAIVKDTLEASGDDVALIARSGLDLHRFDVRYSHAGVSLKTSGNAPWSVRQLYYACDERRPRLYDQGLPGFLLGTDDPAVGYVSIVLLPRAEADALAGAALDTPRAMRLLAGTYSANAHPYSLRYQNCNQWVMELIAAAWAPLADAPGLRAQAQRWLADNGYAPQPVDLHSHLWVFAASFVPWVHLDDHPQEDRFALRVRTSLPATIEAFVHERLPGARRIELCHDERRVVVHEGWTPVGEGCRPQGDDRVIALD